MKLESTAKQLRIYIGENDRHEGRPLYEAIVNRAKERGMAGATVFRAMMGFGANSRIHTGSMLRLSADLPIVVEVVDNADRIDAFLPELNEYVTDGLITIEDIGIVLYKSSSADEEGDG